MEYLEIGQIVNTYGIKGVVKINAFTDDIKRFDKLKTIYIEKQGKLIKVNLQEVKYSKNMVLLKIEGIDQIEEAESYKNCYIKIDRKDAITLPKNTYFIKDLIGINVYTYENVLLGNIIDIFKTGANDVYVVKDSLGKQILLPAIKDVILSTDVENKKMIIKLIKGLI